MLTTATSRAWGGHAAQGIVGGYDHLHRHHLLGQNDGAGGSQRQKLGMTRAVAPPPPPPPICNEGVEERRKRKKQEWPSPEVGEADGWGTVEEETKTGKGAGLSSVAVCPPSRQLCFDCGTSRTPMWRKGPAGPKSLCNACGIRYRKLKRAGGAPSTLAATAPAAASGGVRPKGNTRASPGMPLSLKLPAAAEGMEEKKLRRRQRRRQEVLWRLLEESRKFESPCGKEAVEAAVLLMAMSSGLFIRSC